MNILKKWDRPNGENRFHYTWRVTQPRKCPPPGVVSNVQSVSLKWLKWIYSWKMGSVRLKREAPFQELFTCTTVQTRCFYSGRLLNFILFSFLFYKMSCWIANCWLNCTVHYLAHPLKRALYLAIILLSKVTLNPEENDNDKHVWVCTQTQTDTHAHRGVYY